MAEDEQNLVDQLTDLFVYAPVGLLYEYQEVIPKLVRRGKSQVQIAKVIGQLAVKGGGADTFTMVAEGVASVLARQITELGEAIGLAPPSEEAGRPSESGTPPPPTAEHAVDQADLPPPLPEVAEVEDRPLPIARYDELKAKDIVALLDELESDQLDRIRAHEEANRARKTVLGKLDRLAR